MTDLRAALTDARTNPIFEAVAVPLARLIDDSTELTVSELDRVLGPAAGVRFALQGQVRRRGTPFVRTASYDGSITTAGVVPTRQGSVHDVMNALVWAAFPRAKRAIHARQFAALSREVDEGRTALPGRRSRLRDRLSMLDEGGVVVVADPRWEPTAGSLVHPGTLPTFVLGHAILEHALGRDASQVRGCVVSIEPFDTSLDEALARALERPDEALEAWIARFESIEVGRLFPARAQGPANAEG